jgi:hypothetical protein
MSVHPTTSYVWDGDLTRRAALATDKTTAYWPSSNITGTVRDGNLLAAISCRADRAPKVTFHPAIDERHRAFVAGLASLRLPVSFTRIRDGRRAPAT